jgi:hypothetical protein
MNFVNLIVVTHLWPLGGCSTPFRLRGREKPVIFKFTQYQIILAQSAPQTSPSETPNTIETSSDSSGILVPSGSDSQERKTSRKDEEVDDEKDAGAYFRMLAGVHGP